MTDSDRRQAAGHEPDEFDHIYTRTRAGAPDITTPDLIGMLVDEADKLAAAARGLADDIGSNPMDETDDEDLRPLLIQAIHNVVQVRAWIHRTMRAEDYDR